MTEGIYDITSRLPEKPLTKEEYNLIEQAILQALEDNN